MSITRLEANGDKFTLYAVCNSRGDVEELRKETGSLYARYVYDSWGNVLYIYSGTGTTKITDTDNLAVQNPFRYRGYYYDAESGLYYLQSRYYDPVTGRFVNVDNVTDGGSGVIGNNLYVYTSNNPVNNSDPTGHGIIKNIIKLFVDKVTKPIVDVCEKIAKKVVKGTRMVGITGNVAFGLQYTVSRGIAFDGNGNIGYVETRGFGGGTPNLSIGVFETKTNAPDIKKLEGFSAQIGGSADVYGVSVGIEPTFFNDSETNELYVGFTSSMSVGLPIPVEIHGDCTNTELKSVNIFEEYYNVYEAIMEW